MKTVNEARAMKKKFWFYAILALLLIAGLFSASMASARGNRGRTCYGTYFVKIGQGDGRSEGIWTIAKDGTMQLTDSAEMAFDFSHQQGAWKRTAANEAQAVWIDFNFHDTSGVPEGYARVEADFLFAPGCDTFSGLLDILLYAPGEDPLDPEGGSIGTIEDVTFTGRRLNP